MPTSPNLAPESADLSLAPSVEDDLSRDAPGGVPVYLPSAPDVTYAMYHAPRAPARGTAILFCPPFGWEDMCSHRSRRDWAASLAGAGYPVLRIDLPGTGDSAGNPGDPARLEAWTAAVTTAAAWLRATCPASRVAGMGIGLGGLVAHRAAALGAPIDDLMLWGVPARGSVLARELHMFASVEVSEHVDAGLSQGGPTGDGSMSVAGYLVSAETVSDLKSLDLSALPLADARARRVLLFERDGRAVDARLRASYEQQGAEVEVAPGSGYAQMMMVEPPAARSADQVLAHVKAWLDRAPERLRSSSSSAAPVPVTVKPNATTEILQSGGLIRETAWSLAHPFGDLSGILTQPVGPSRELCVVLLNAGFQRRTGPNRMYVEAARRWAALGVPTLRVDLAGIGDADGDDTALREPLALYAAAYVDQVAQALDALQDQGLPPRFVLGGLCAGGYWAHQVLSKDERVTCALMLNPRVLIYDADVERTVKEVRVLARKAMRASTWARVLHRQTTFSAHVFTARLALLGLMHTVRSLPARRRARPAGPPLEQLFDGLRDQGRRAVIVFAGEEPMHARLERDGYTHQLDRWPNIRLEHIDVPLDVHTLRPQWLQQQVHRCIDEALERELML